MHLQKSRILNAGNCGDSLLTAHLILCWLRIHIYSLLIQTDLPHILQSDVFKKSKLDYLIILLKAFNDLHCIMINSKLVNMACEVPHDWVPAYFLHIFWCFFVSITLRSGKRGALILVPHNVHSPQTQNKILNDIRTTLKTTWDLSFNFSTRRPIPLKMCSYD